MNSEDVKALKSLLDERQKIVIVPHKNPDGDAIGATLALNHYLNDTGHEAVVITPNDFPKFLKWMPGHRDIVNFEKENSRALDLLESATLFFTLDFNQLSRTGHMQSILENAATPVVMIDHHQEPADYATIQFSDTSMSSTCEMVYTLIEELGLPHHITPDIASCIYAGILTDTGSFKYASTSSRTHRVVADLIDKGVKNTEIHHNIYDSNSPDRIKLLGCALANLVVLPEYNAAYTTLNQDELDAHNYKKGDTEGFVNYALTLNDVRLAAIFIENREEGIIKISFRSQGDFSVNDLARDFFEGGGHTNAAGGKSDRSLAQTIAYFIALLDNYKTVLNK